MQDAGITAKSQLSVEQKSLTALIGGLCLLGALSFLRGRRLALLLSLGILRRSGLIAGHFVHRVSGRMCLDVSFAGRNRLSGITRCWARTCILPRSIAGTGVRNARAQNHCGASCEEHLFPDHESSPWFPSPQVSLTPSAQLEE
jgi:hypothetical protein